MIRNEISINQKIGKTLSFLLILFAIVVGRLFYLQILEQHNFIALGEKNYRRTEFISSPRGNILDHNGKLLATNKPITSLYWMGTGNYNLTKEQFSIMKRLEEILESPLIDPLHVQLQKAERSSTRQLLMVDVPLNKLGQILEQFPNHHNLSIQTNFKRHYPHKKLASHILGHINRMNLDTIGKMGLEKIVHTDLQGERGIIIKTINSMGTKLAQQEIKQAMAGQNISTTLDLDLQKLAESLFPAHYSGSILVMDPKNGALRAVVSQPNFDPAAFLEPINTDQWQKLQAGRPFLNRAFTACYPPASIFKLVTISAGLELGYLNLDDVVTCNGFVRFKGRRYYCNRRTGHGSLTLRESVAKSCNALFYELGIQMHIDELADYAHRYGLGEKTGIIFSEHPGLVPSSLWKQEVKGERWWQGETLSVTIGQSFLLATPIQIARMIAGIFEGQLPRPRILESEPIEIQPITIEKPTRKFLKDSMKLVVKIGTGRYVSKIEDIKIYAKTGTAQTTSLAHRNKSPEGMEHAWFVGYFKHKNSDPLVMVIFIEHACYSRIAATVAKKFLLNYRAMMQKRS